MFRLDLQRAFGLSTSDLDGVLKTFNRVTVDECQRSWTLNHDDVETFGAKYKIFFRFAERFCMELSRLISALLLL